MARLARVIVPGLPHHVVQRGNRKQTVFFMPEDYRIYLDLLSFWCRKNEVAIWVYCLMTNHVHLIVVPRTEAGLRRAVAETHRRYSRLINFRNGWKGCLFQGRFSSYPLDTKHLLAATRYIERNPIAAGLVEEPEHYPWSSAGAHVTGQMGRHLDPVPLFDEMRPWKTFLMNPLGYQIIQDLRKHERTGRPLGSDMFINRLEHQTGRRLRPRRPGRKANGATLEMRIVSPD
jgi:putative transposase